jgi:hypothetical protein
MKKIHYSIISIAFVAVSAVGITVFAQNGFPAVNTTTVHTAQPTNNTDTPVTTAPGAGPAAPLNGTQAPAGSQTSTNSHSTSLNTNPTPSAASQMQVNNFNAAPAPGGIAPAPGGVAPAPGGNGNGNSLAAMNGVGKIQNPINVSDFGSFIASVLGLILKIAIPIVAAFIIYSGLMFVLARGNSEKLEKAKTRFLYTLIGAGILLGAWMIATVIKATIEALMA